MPLLRYVSEDFANIANIICKCGRKTQILEKIIGRKRDIIQTKKGDYILRHSLFLFNHPDIEQFQIRQTNKDKITIYIVPKNKINLEKIESIQKEFGEFLDFNANVNVKLLKDIPKAKSGKTLYFISDLGAHE